MVERSAAGARAYKNAHGRPSPRRPDAVTRSGAAQRSSALIGCSKSARLPTGYGALDGVGAAWPGRVSGPGRMTAPDPSSGPIGRSVERPSFDGLWGHLPPQGGKSLIREGALNLDLAADLDDVVVREVERVADARRVAAHRVE